MSNTKSRVSELAKVALVAALYVALTFVSPSYGAIQCRFSEIFNNLTVFNKRYIAAVTLGCFIANLWSPLGIVDIVFGTLGTVVMTSLSYFLSKRVSSVPAKLAICVAVCTLMSWSVALELHIVSQAPFWMTYLTVGIGEFIATAFGAVITYILSSKLDLTD